MYVCMYNCTCQSYTISPNHLLTMKSSVIMPPPVNFENEGSYAKKSAYTPNKLGHMCSAHSEMCVQLSYNYLFIVILILGICHYICMNYVCVCECV